MYIIAGHHILFQPYLLQLTDNALDSLILKIDQN